MNFVLENAPELREAIVRRNIRDVVAQKIANLIASGLLKIGDDLPSERDLAVALRVSRESVRGGIQILSAKGLLAVVQGARTRVVSDDLGPEFKQLREPRLINSYGIDDIHAARLLVERTVVGDAAERIDDETLAILRDSLEAQRFALDDPVRFIIIDREFHQAIYRASGNPVLADFVGDLYAYMMEHRRKAVSEPGAIERSFGDHQRIVSALERRDRAGVVATFEIHIDRIYQTTLSILRPSGRGPEGALEQQGP
ncbi:GntR family transcriptional regulator [Aureimonas sp. Leaf454]|uniref:FadR/GntR family transcriptional regulator n=1 Tax=Aureimonas sp. Leaf454 TaxID=1736381 RepID=UPI0006FB967E|nr:FadR/GntR family transcriptional regulator [Aureimonas sp. Leaf454]KQT54482.1 GntR family transcriptional regulator [Aureimonas sp. Leaf454]